MSQDFCCSSCAGTHSGFQNGRRGLEAGEKLVPATSRSRGSDAGVLGPFASVIWVYAKSRIIIYADGFS